MSLKIYLKKRLNIAKYLRSKYAPISAKKPNYKEYTFSDLFFWRARGNWETEFDLIPYTDLINPENQNKRKENLIKLLILSKNGKIINQEVLHINRFKKNTFKISDYLPNFIEENDYGNFLIFHKYHQNRNNLIEGFIAERGYVKYNYKKKDIFSYTHANLDAISADFNKIDLNLFTYTKSTLLKRTYRVQYLFRKDNNYEIILSNPTKRIQNYEIIYFNKNMELILTKKIMICSLGIRIIESPCLDSGYYIFIKSKIPMSRPSIFKYENNLVDVFHG